MKQKTSYQRAHAVADKLASDVFNRIQSSLDRAIGTQGFVEVRMTLRSCLYVAAHKAIVAEMRAAAKARKASK